MGNVLIWESHNCHCVKWLWQPSRRMVGILCGTGGKDRKSRDACWLPGACTRVRRGGALCSVNPGLSFPVPLVPDSGFTGFRLHVHPRTDSFQRSRSAFRSRVPLFSSPYHSLGPFHSTGTCLVTGELSCRAGLTRQNFVGNRWGRPGRLEHLVRLDCWGTLGIRNDLAAATFLLFLQIAVNGS